MGEKLVTQRSDSVCLRERGGSDELVSGGGDWWGQNGSTEGDGERADLKFR